MTDILNLLAPIAIILGATLTASNLGSRITGTGFIFFTIGSLCWLAIGVLMGPGSLVWQNIILTCLNAFGIWRWLGRQREIEDGGEKAQEISEQRPGEALFPARALHGSKLLSRHGDELGSLVDAMVGAKEGRLAYLVVADGGVAGVGETLRCVDWHEVEEREGCFHARFDRERFEQLKTIERDDWPSR